MRGLWTNASFSVVSVIAGALWDTIVLSSVIAGACGTDDRFLSSVIAGACGTDDHFLSSVIAGACGTDDRFLSSVIAGACGTDDRFLSSVIAGACGTDDRFFVVCHRRGLWDRRSFFVVCQRRGLWDRRSFFVVCQHRGLWDRRSFFVVCQHRGLWDGRSFFVVCQRRALYRPPGTMVCPNIAFLPIIVLISASDEGDRNMTDNSVSRRLFLSAVAAAPAAPALTVSDRIAIFDPPPDRVRIVVAEASFVVPPPAYTPAEIQQIKSAASGKPVEFITPATLRSCTRCCPTPTWSSARSTRRCSRGPRICGGCRPLKRAWSTILFPELIKSNVVVTNMARMFAPGLGDTAMAMLLSLTRGLQKPTSRSSRSTSGSADFNQVESMA